MLILKCFIFEKYKQKIFKEVCNVSFEMLEKLKYAIVTWNVFQHFYLEFIWNLCIAPNEKCEITSMNISHCNVLART